MIEWNNAIIIGGGNLGDRMGYLIEAERIISTLIGSIQLKSGVYESESWGFESDDSFLNQVFVVRTKLSPEFLLDKLLTIEKMLGRERNLEKSYQSRTMDLDILFYNELVYESNRLIIPHPRIAERNFVLSPLVEIMPNFIHPITGFSILEMIKRCNDQSIVKVYE